MKNKPFGNNLHTAFNAQKIIESGNSMASLSCNWNYQIANQTVFEVFNIIICKQLQEKVI